MGSPDRKINNPRLPSHIHSKMPASSTSVNPERDLNHPLTPEEPEELRLSTRGGVLRYLGPSPELKVHSLAQITPQHACGPCTPNILLTRNYISHRKPLPTTHPHHHGFLDDVLSVFMCVQVYLCAGTGAYVYLEARGIISGVIS